VGSGAAAVNSFCVKGPPVVTSTQVVSAITGL
jgi:hypothetical protein